MDNKVQLSLDTGDQLVYQLVRVEEDGTVVPASEDEVIEVESFLEGGTILHSSLANRHDKGVHEGVSEQDDSLALNERLSDPQCLDGDGRLRKRLIAQLTFLDTLLDRLNEKKNINGLAGVEVRSYISRKRRHGNQLNLPMLRPSTNAFQSQDVVIKQCLQNHNDVNTNSDTNGYNLEKIDSKVDLGTGKNFSLHNISIQELHEAFRTTLGQQTSVKKRKWLEQGKNIGLECSVKVYSACIPKGTQDSHTSQIPEAASKSYPLKNNEHSEISDDLGKAHSNTPIKLLNKNESKRKRKPTKRYIEELALPGMKGIIDCNGSSIKKSSLKNRHGKKNVKNILKASEINFRSKSKFFGCSHKTGKVRLSSKSSGRAAQLVRKAISARSARKSKMLSPTEKKIKKKLLPNDVEVKSTQTSHIYCSETNANAKDLNSSESAVNNVHHVSLKKNHHPWTIGEVTKLLEGVTRFGVGKWSDMKNILFSDVNHRSSTDLKDKWRNLVRASNRHYKVKSQEGQHHRKHSLIPNSILVQVHELAAQRRHIRKSRNESSSIKSTPVKPSS